MEMGWVDFALLALVLLSVIVGMVRGLVFELLSLFGWLAAYVGAQMFASTVAAYLPVGSAGSNINLAAAFALTFVAVLVAWTLMARLLRLVLHATPLTVIDRLLGAAFGGLRGALVLLVVATVVAMTPASRAPAWRGSAGAAWAGAAIEFLRPWLPEEVTKHLPQAGRVSTERA